MSLTTAIAKAHNVLVGDLSNTPHFAIRFELLKVGFEFVGITAGLLLVPDELGFQIIPAVIVVDQVEVRPIGSGTQMVQHLARGIKGGR
jgi:hypothetical protein